MNRIVSFSIAAMLGSFIAGCGQHYDQNYNVMIDNAFDDASKETIIEALGEWENKTQVTPYPLHLNVYFADRSDCPYTKQDASICIFSSTFAEVEAYGQPSNHDFTRRDFASDSSMIFLNMENQGTIKTLYETTAHEMGHALGLQHTGSGTVMCANSDCAVPHLTETDLYQYTTLRD